MSRYNNWCRSSGCATARRPDASALWHLSHTTGLPYHAYTHLLEQGYDIPTLMQKRFSSSCRWPGKKAKPISYQNAVFCVVEEMMKVATGETYQALLNEKIFRPANMRTASCDYASICGTVDKALPHYPVRGAFCAPTVLLTTITMLPQRAA